MKTITAFTESRVRLNEQCETLVRELDAWHQQKDTSDAPPAPVFSVENDLAAKIEASWTKQSRVRCNVSHADIPRCGKFALYHGQPRSASACVPFADPLVASAIFAGLGAQNHVVPTSDC